MANRSVFPLPTKKTKKKQQQRKLPGVQEAYTARNTQKSRTRKDTMVDGHCNTLDPDLGARIIMYVYVTTDL